MKKLVLIALCMISTTGIAQESMTPETLWKLGRVSALGISKDGKSIVYKVSKPDMIENKLNSTYYSIPISGGKATAIEDYKSFLEDKNISNGKTLSHKEIKIEKVLGKDFYPELEKSNVQIYDGLDYRHWDTWNEGKHNHVFVNDVDIMENEPYDCPQKPFGGDEDYIFSPDGKKVVYVSKKKAGTAYATSTNTDLYEYDIATKTTKTLQKRI